MKVFLSWSGPRAKAVATALRDWLPGVLQNLDVWMSGEDIQAGQRWLAEIGSQLESTMFGIVCVTPENQLRPWLHFEAGALAKATEKSRVIPYLIDMDFPQLQEGPLTQFQGKRADKDGTFEMMKAVFSASGAKVTPENFEKALNLWWPALEKALGEAIAEKAPAAPKPRAEREILEEVLELVRSLARERAATLSKETIVELVQLMVRELDRPARFASVHSSGDATDVRPSAAFVKALLQHKHGLEVEAYGSPPQPPDPKKE